MVYVTQEGLVVSARGKACDSRTLSSVTAAATTANDNDTISPDPSHNDLSALMTGLSAVEGHLHPALCKLATTPPWTLIFVQVDGGCSILCFSL